jgi:hypothetical protein
MSNELILTARNCDIRCLKLAICYSTFLENIAMLTGSAEVMLVCAAEAPRMAQVRLTIANFSSLIVFIGPRLYMFVPLASTRVASMVE